MSLFFYDGSVVADRSRPFDVSSVCVGGSHVIKYSTSKPIVLVAGTTLRAIACARGGNSPVVRHVLRVQSPPGDPVLEYLMPPHRGPKRHVPTGS